ncbi:MAG: hypothetical protein CVV24_06205 [Ignavibacteriae bacterium HGW-Ignavibacteriae-3]|nr:MAG: hypothetical protein CVV24_06205 [Ignavibacteriae bacterium HGW-Ignavibacteriae-3]
MVKSRSYKTASCVVLFAYINLMTLSIFHFHAIDSSFDSSAFNAAGIPANIHDPFSDGNSGCRVTLFNTISFIGEKEFCSNNSARYSSADYSGLILSGNPLQIINDSNSLRAPPHQLIN